MRKKHEEIRLLQAWIRADYDEKIPQKLWEWIREINRDSKHKEEFPFFWSDYKEELTVI